MTAYSYSDLLLNGTVNPLAFTTLLDSRVLAEINRRLCVDAGRRFPRTLPLGESSAWYAATVKAHGLGPIGDDERRRIAADMRREMEATVQALKVGAERQRRAMRASEFLDAAE